MRFVHRIDALKRRVQIVEVRLEALQAASFLDGRQAFWSSSDSYDVARMRALLDPSTTAVRGWIFHVGFCGSTLLSHLLEQPRDVLALREPQALVDLADQAPQLRMLGRAQAMTGWVEFLDTHFGGLADAALPVVVKPSNWVNPLLPDLAACGLLEKAVFVTMERRAWLRACIRGGRDRLAWVARCVQHTAQTDADVARLMPLAANGVRDPLDQVVRLAALLEWAQARSFACFDPQGARSIDYREIVDDPARAVARTRCLLDLPASASPIVPLEHHAKDPGQAFDAETRAREDREVELAHGVRIDAALAWIDCETGPRPARRKRA
ncbi:hypothetical protein I5E68_13180 [Novosphingobium sp. YJ-S2-02]|uniref:Uncharacterized protein n=1 Tax=Novosphingobium aureum TaxID=2792964 RepID=A0A931HDR3_9SPHN|nr:hypothetical protein [Novosphingobium aureum]MBH0113899.1 hypothetical protein [Novosphingobium aureum]